MSTTETENIFVFVPNIIGESKELFLIFFLKIKQSKIYSIQNS